MHEASVMSHIDNCHPVQQQRDGQLNTGVQHQWDVLDVGAILVQVTHDVAHKVEGTVVSVHHTLGLTCRP